MGIFVTDELRQFFKCYKFSKNAMNLRFWEDARCESCLLAYDGSVDRDSISWYLCNLSGDRGSTSVHCSDCVEESAEVFVSSCEDCMARWRSYGHAPGLYGSNYDFSSYPESKNPIVSDASHTDGGIALRDYFA